MDAITMLKDDHATVEKLFKRFEQAGDRAHVEKRRIVDRIIEELSQHAAVEEMLFYPVTRATVPAVEDVALESIEEHHIVKWVLSELERMDPADERFDAKVTVLIENVRHHVTEEEGEYFPEVRSELGRKALTELGDAMVEAKTSAPLRPHPESPDAPPGNLVVGPMAGVADRLGATVGGVVQGGVSAVQDLIDRIRGTQSSRPSPTGSSVARKTAGSVRSGAEDAVDKMIAVVKEAKAGTEEVAETAGDSARQTASTAKEGGGKVADTARSSARKTAKTARA
ncbi:MAG TPA: hemerythrin domain-containing protein [Acidimicrobiales bacterium]|nr:hemerythrin domain-containing protein [Acidimicrobiales bacterium]